MRAVDVTLVQCQSVYVCITRKVAVLQWGIKTHTGELVMDCQSHVSGGNLVIKLNLWPSAIVCKNNDALSCHMLGC